MKAYLKRKMAKKEEILYPILGVELPEKKNMQIAGLYVKWMSYVLLMKY